MLPASNVECEEGVTVALRWIGIEEARTSGVAVASVEYAATQVPFVCQRMEFLGHRYLSIDFWVFNETAAIPYLALAQGANSPDH